MSAETAWFTRTPGDAASVGSEEHGDPREVLVHMGAAPDWVMQPDELGGAKLRVTGERRAQCPACKAGPEVRYLLVEQGFQVAECLKHGFIWCKERGT